MRISDWSSDVCSSDLAPQRQINYLLLASAYSSLRRQGVSALRIPDLLKESSRFAAWPASLSTLVLRSEEHTSELQSLMRISYAVFCLKKKTQFPYVH